MEFVEFSAKTTAEALTAAGKHFDLPIDRLEIEVVSAGSSGIFGMIGRKKAMVKARPKGKSAAQEVADLVSVVSGKPAPRPQAAAKPEPKPEAKPAPRPQPQPAAQPPAQTQTSAPAPTAQAAAIPRSAPVLAPATQAKPAAAPNAQAECQPKPAAPRPAERPPRPRPVQAAPPREEALKQTAGPEDEPDAKDDSPLGIPKGERPSPELMKKAENALARMSAALDATATVSVGNGEEGIELTIQGEDPGVFIGRRGQTLDALQYLVTRMVSQAAGKSVRVVVDAGGYRARRRDSLKEMAAKLAEKASGSGHPVSTGPLNAQDRRVVHLCLKDKNGIHTVSRGRGEMKKVVISAKPQQGRRGER